MKIYKQEINDGLDAVISSQACVTYASIAEPCSNSTSFNFNNIKSIAALDDSDLYYVQSILVSSSWNKNDDIFDREEIWKAKSTPEDKPTNLEHDENIIIGHITSNYPITDSGEIIPPDTPPEQLPEKYHILTGSVIYRGFTNPELKERSEQLIAEIENGTKYVSMECFFNDFDYGLKNSSTGEFKILKRQEDTSYLTKHLRAYGGSGNHEGYTIGRVLRNITFSGKGFVDRPANSDSIIFSKTMFDNFLNKNTVLEKKGVIDNKPFSKSENKIMNLEETIENVNTKLETLLKSEASKACELESKVQELETSATESQKAFDEQLEKFAALEAAMKNKEEEMKKKEEEMKKMEEEKASLRSELEATNEVLAGYKMKEEEMAKKEKKMKRMASLIEAGVDTEQSKELASKMEDFSDDQFDTVVAALANVKVATPPVVETEVATETEASETTESVADASDLENVEAEPEVNLAVSEETDGPAIEAQVTRAALIDFVKSRLQITK